MSGDGAAWYPLDWSPDDGSFWSEEHVSIARRIICTSSIWAPAKGARWIPPPPRSRISGQNSRATDQGVYPDLGSRRRVCEDCAIVNIFTGEKNDICGTHSLGHRAIGAFQGRALLGLRHQRGRHRQAQRRRLAHSPGSRCRRNCPPPGVIDSLSFDREGKRLAFGLTAANQPRDAYVLDMASNRLEAWTASEPGPMDPAKFVMPRLTQFPTFDRSDGKSAPDTGVRLRAGKARDPIPCLIMLHGGPDSQFRPTFDPWIQYVVNELGFAVLAPNVRGSSGYGKIFFVAGQRHAARGRRQGRRRADGVARPATQVRCEARRGVRRRYGGYLALAALVNYGDRLRGGVDFAGITDFVSFLSNDRAVPPESAARGVSAMSAMRIRAHIFGAFRR